MCIEPSPHVSSKSVKRSCVELMRGIQCPSYHVSPWVRQHSCGSDMSSSQECNSLLVRGRVRSTTHSPSSKQLATKASFSLQISKILWYLIHNGTSPTKYLSKKEFLPHCSPYSSLPSEKRGWKGRDRDRAHKENILERGRRFSSARTGRWANVSPSESFAAADVAGGIGTIEVPIITAH